MTLRYVPIVFALASLATASAFAQGSTRSAHGASDANGDGVVDRREFQQRMVDVFYFQDANRDGRLEPTELPKLSPKAFAAADMNRDGALQLEEFLNARSRDFTAADRNGDGSLSLDEASAFE